MIGRQYGVSAQAIAAANGIGNPNLIFAGQRLIIPGAGAPAPSAPVAQPAASSATGAPIGTGPGLTPSWLSTSVRK